MRKITTNKKLLINAVINESDRNKIDFFLSNSNETKLYLCTRKFNNMCYRMCATKIPLDEFLYEKRFKHKSKNDIKEYFKTVEYIKRILPDVFRFYDLNEMVA
ncbi:MAG: hypothetical protein K6F77_09195 [Lachnospiraceae bacterium]|nr:hypothetical protein [Lachnospiraceae bacterium]